MKNVLQIFLFALLTSLSGWLIPQKVQAQSYRYLKFTVTNSSGLKIHELSWLANGKHYPTEAMTSNESAGAVVDGWDGYKAYDDNFGTDLWVGTSTNSPFLIDFGANPITPSGIEIQKEAWEKLLSFKCEGSSDNENWDLLYETSIADSDQDWKDKSRVFLFQTDNDAPTAPSGLIAGNVTGTSFQLSWNVSSDNVAVADYEVFKGAVSLGKTKTTSMAIERLTPGSEYSFTVKAIDTEGNVSEASAPLVVSTASAPAASGYQYVRFVTEQNTDGLHLTELAFLNGEVVYPKLPMTSSEGSMEATTEGAYNAYKLFDQQTEESVYLNGTPEGEAAVILNFKDHVIYPTGIHISKPGWSNLKEFRIEATNDPESGWTTVYASPANMDYTYFQQDGTVGIFVFGTAAVAVDTTPPATPALTADKVTHNSVQISWPAVSDNASAIAGYQVFFNGESQGFTTSTTFSKEFTLTPATDYEVAVVAYDSEFNASATGTLTVRTQETPVAQGYKYLRFWVDQVPDAGSIQLVELRWLMGDRGFPLNPVAAASGDEAVEILSTNENIYNFDGPYKAFDGQHDTHWYVAQGKEVTLHFKNIERYATGIEITHYNWNHLLGFHCQGSNDNENWTTLYEGSNLSGASFPINGNIRTGRFNFGTKLPDDLDMTAPSVPIGLTARQTTSTYAEISWDASSDQGTGVAAYKIFVDGAQWAQSTRPAFTVYGLSPETAYDITVSAMDKLGNESSVSEVVSVTMGALEPAVGAMAIGSGLGSDTKGVWKEGVDFAAAWANYESANPFSETFLEEIEHYKVLRFMDMVSTNNNWIEHWSDRRQPDDSEQVVHPNYDKNQEMVLKGVAVEWMIKLCNLTGADMWINVPHAANDDYMQQLATLIKQHLDPSLKVYIEYSNEVWGGFGAETYATNKGKALGLHRGDFPRYAWFTEDWYARFRFYVYRSVQMYDIFNTVFADDKSSVKKVLAGWAGQPDLTRIHLDALAEAAINPEGIYPDHYAIAPYFAWNVTTNSANLLPDFRATIEETAKGVKAHYAILSASGRNIPLIAYEGGQHITNGGELINRKPVMYQAYIEYLNALSPYFEVFPHFVHFSPYTRSMAWGAKEYVGQPDLLAYKYRALKDWQAANADNAKIQAPYILEEPQAVTVAEGSGATFKLVVIGEQPMAYQWYENGKLIEGATDAQLSLQQVGADKSGHQYSVAISNASGEVTSQAAILTVTEVEKALVSKALQAVTVDGEAEAAWEQTTAYPLAKVSLGSVDNESDLSGYFKTMWDENYLYVLVNITDNALVPVEDANSIWNYDGVEVYLDATNDKTDTYNTNDRQIVFTYQGDQLIGASGSMSLGSARAKQTLLTNGYQTEFAFAWSDMGVTPEAGHYLGLDVMVADNDTPGGNREGKKAWWATEDLSWQQPANFGTALLEDIEPVQALTLTSLCSFSPEQELNWQLINPNAFEVAYSWELQGTNLKGSGTAQPGEQTITIPAAGDHTLILLWKDETHTQQSITLTSEGGTPEPAFPIVDRKGKPARLSIKVKGEHNGSKTRFKLKDFSDVHRLVVVSTNPITAAPQDGQRYAASLTYGEGDAIGAGGFVVRNNHKDKKDDFILTDLSPATKYYVAVFVYEPGNDCGPNYRETPVVTTSFTTRAAHGKYAWEHTYTHQFDFNLFPNQAHDYFTIRYTAEQEQRAVVSIKNVITGLEINQKWKLQTGANELQFNTQALKSGVYMVTVTTATKTVSRRLSVIK